MTVPKRREPPAPARRRPPPPAARRAPPSPPKRKPVALQETVGNGRDLGLSQACIACGGTKKSSKGGFCIGCRGTGKQNWDSR